MASCTIEAGVLFNNCGRERGGTYLALRAVVFDFGMVLTGQPDQAAYNAMVRITGLPVERFEQHYWQDRQAYDEGKLTGNAFWQKFVRDAGLSLNEATVEELNELDARHWTTQNPAMLAWQLALKQRGLLTGILSNMGDKVCESIEREFDWLHRFDALVWSYQLGIAKPAPAIYLHILHKLNVRPEETLFLDDKLENIQAALALGINSIQFSTVAQLSDDLVARRLTDELPLPK